MNALPSVSITSSDTDNSICAGESVTYTSSGANLYEYFINGISQGAPSPTPSVQINSLQDNDIISVEGVSMAGCKNNDIMSPIEVLSIPNINLASSDPDQQICDGNSVTFTATGSNEYEFFINGASQGFPSVINTATFNTLNNGDVITCKGTSSGCFSLSNPLSFQVFNYPIVDLSNNEDTVLCVDEFTNLTSNGADNYLFYINGSPVGTMSSANTFNSLLNDGDVVSVKGETNGCTSFAGPTFAYSVFNYPTISAVSSDVDFEICLNDTVTFTSSGANEYIYELNGLQVGNNTTGIFETNHISNGDVVSITGYNAHCASSPTNFQFFVNQMNLGLTVSPSNMICEGEQVDFSATGADEYEFFLNGNSTGAPSASSVYSSNGLSHHDKITLTAYNNTTGCSQMFDDYVIMNVLSEPIITPLSSTTFCEGDSVILVSNADYGNQWFLDNNPINGTTDTSVVAVSFGSYSLGVTMGGDGDLWSKGQNSSGVFANGNSFNSSSPTASNSGLKFTEISAGFKFVLGIDVNKEVYAWGNNATGQLGNGTYTSSTIPIKVGALSNIKTIATGSNSSMVTAETGEVYVWGNNIYGQLGTGNTSIINFPFLSPTLTDVDSIAAGRSHYVVLKNNGTVQTVGNNDYGQLGNGSLTGSSTPVTLALSNIVAVGANEYSSYAIDNTGILYVWGNNASGQLGLGDLTNRLSPAPSPLKNVVSAQGGANHSVFLTSDHKVYTAGGNAYGQLGISSHINSNIPKQVDIQDIDMIAAGQYTTLLKRTDHSVFACGNNTENQLSAISDTAITSPVLMTDLEGVTFIESGQNSSHFLYGQNTSCESSPVNVTFLPSPSVIIFANGDTLYTNQPSALSYQWFFNGNIVPGATAATYKASISGTYNVEAVYSNGCSSSASDYYHSVTGVKIEKGFSFILYPNPVRNNLTIQLNNNVGKVKISIVDNIGKIVAEIEETSKTFSIPCENLENGLYHLQISSQYGNAITRFVVNH